MQKIFYLIIISALVVGCNNEDKKIGDPLKMEADSITNKVLEGHDVGMAKMSKISKAQNQVNKLIDSLSKLHGKADLAMRSGLDSLKKDLDYADFAMNKWMEEFRYDTFTTDLKSRIHYMTNENEKVTKVKDAMLRTLTKADSILKREI